MKELTKLQVLDVMRYAGEFQREVFRLYSVDVTEVTKYKSILTISVHYDASIVSFKQLLTRFVAYFVDYEIFIDKDLCFSTLLKSGQCAAHFELKFYA